MNIKNHIEAGHYPKDEKGRALVPISHGGDTFVVLATDVPGRLPIVGYRLSNWQISPHSADTDFLLPPPPRKVEVKRWAVFRPADSSVMGLHMTETDAATKLRDRPDLTIIELTGSYEEPWS